MAPKRVTVPEPGVREIAHALAYKIARERLADIKDIEKQCLRSGARCLPDEKSVVLKYLDRDYQINLPGGEITLFAGSEAPSFEVEIHEVGPGAEVRRDGAWRAVTE